jgi:hypothetical protein
MEQTRPEQHHRNVLAVRNMNSIDHSSKSLLDSHFEKYSDLRQDILLQDSEVGVDK